MVDSPRRGFRPPEADVAASSQGGEKYSQKDLPTILSESKARSSLLVLLSAPVDNTPFIFFKIYKKDI